MENNYFIPTETKIKQLKEDWHAVGQLFYNIIQIEPSSLVCKMYSQITDVAFILS